MNVLQIVPSIFVFFAMLSLGAMIFLAENIDDLARTISSAGFAIKPGNGPEKTSNRTIWIALSLFVLGGAAAMLTWFIGAMLVSPG